jgi:hypothetical protein
VFVKWELGELFSFVSTDIIAVYRTRTYQRESINTIIIIYNFQELRTRVVNRIKERSDEQFHDSCSTYTTRSSAPLNDFPESSYGGIGS